MIQQVPGCLKPGRRSNWAKTVQLKRFNGNGFKGTGFKGKRNSSLSGLLAAEGESQ